MLPPQPPRRGLGRPPAMPWVERQSPRNAGALCFTALPGSAVEQRGGAAQATFFFAPMAGATALVVAVTVFSVISAT
jgi:hypothetical protein